MSQPVKNQKKLKSVELNLVAEVAKRLSSGGLSAADVQALLEKKPSGESSLDSKIVETFGDYGFTEANFHETIVYNGQLLKRHRNGGGWVPAEQDAYNSAMPYVAPTVTVDLTSMVYGNAKLYDYVVVGNNSSVSEDAKLYDRVSLIGSHVYGRAVLAGFYLVSGAAVCGSFFKKSGMIFGGMHDS